MFTVMPTYRY